MSPRQQSARDAVVNAVIGAVAALIISQGVPGVWRSKETVAAHDADINRIMDVLCEMKPQARACTSPKLGNASGQVAQR